MAWNNYGCAAFVSTSSQFWSITDATQVGLDFSTAFTIAFRFKRPVAGVRTDVSKWFSTGSQASYTLDIGTNNKISLQVSGDGLQANAVYFTSTNTYTDTASWHSVVGVYNGSTLVVYYDGSSIDGTITGSVPASLFNSTAPLEVGRYEPSGYSDGLIDDLIVWSRALSATEAGNFHTQQASFVPGASVQGWWKFDDVATDSSGNGNTLTANGGATYNDTDLPYLAGSFGDILGVPVDSFAAMTVTMPLSYSDVAGAPVDTPKMGWGWGGQTKNSASFTNQSKT